MIRNLMFPRSSKKAFKIAAIYLGISATWIFLSDWLLRYFIHDDMLLSEIQTFKGLFFVAVTSLLLYYLIRSNFLEVIQSNKKTEKALKENQVLLSELHHRVKNNLAVICGLMDLQISELDESSGRVLQETQYRIFTLADIEELLYQHGDMASIPFHEYMEQLTSSFQETHEQLPFKTKVDDMYLAIGQAVPLGLLLNEIFTQLRISKKLKNNSVAINLTSNKSHEVSLRLIFDESHVSVLSPLLRKENLEARLLEIYVKQLGSTFEWTQTDGSFVFSLTFEQEET